MTHLFFTPAEPLIRKYFYFRYQLEPLIAINTCFQEPLGLMIGINSHF